MKPRFALGGEIREPGARERPINPIGGVHCLNNLLQAIWAGLGALGMDIYGGICSSDRKTYLGLPNRASLIERSQRISRCAFLKGGQIGPDQNRLEIPVPFFPSKAMCAPMYAGTMMAEAKAKVKASTIAGPGPGGPRSAQKRRTQRWRQGAST